MARKVGERRTVERRQIPDDAFVTGAQILAYECAPRIRARPIFRALLADHVNSLVQLDRPRRREEVSRLKKIQIRKAGPVRLTAAACSIYKVTA